MNIEQKTILIGANAFTDEYEKTGSEIGACKASELAQKKFLRSMEEYNKGNDFILYNIRRIKVGLTNE